MMTGVTMLFARSELTAPSFSFTGIDLAPYPHLAAAFTEPSATPPHRDLFERTLRGLLAGLLADQP